MIRQFRAAISCRNPKAGNKGRPGANTEALELASSASRERATNPLTATSAEQPSRWIGRHLGATCDNTTGGVVVLDTKTLETPHPTAIAVLSAHGGDEAGMVLCGPAARPWVVEPLLVHHRGVVAPHRRWERWARLVEMARSASAVEQEARVGGAPERGPLQRMAPMPQTPSMWPRRYT